MPKILLIRAGSVYPAIQSVHGDFHAWFVRASGLAAESFETVDPTRDALPERLDGYARVLVTGSLRAAYDAEPWVAELERFLRRAAERPLPLLGVCFGLQVIATAFGGRVIRNPRGRELGTTRVELTAAGVDDPLFAGVPQAFPVQSAHDDCVSRLPPAAELLASNSHTEVQAFRIGPHVRAVQFHPEIPSGLMRDLIRHGIDAGELDGDGRELLLRVEPSPAGPHLLRRFLTGRLDV